MKVLATRLDVVAYYEGPDPQGLSDFFPEWKNLGLVPLSRMFELNGSLNVGMFVASINPGASVPTTQHFNSPHEFTMVQGSDPTTLVTSINEMLQLGYVPCEDVYYDATQTIWAMPMIRFSVP